ncbi:MAG: prephenate dehydrogenase/arogenate dehydrogenase family protein [Lachnospiraceae bacterium]|jgi:prephenate dehydrogenase
MKNHVIGFIGFGLIGGSLAKAIKKFRPEYKIYAYNRTRSVVNAAKEEGIVDIVCEEFDVRFAQCDYIFLCATVDYNLQCLKQLKRLISPSCILSDVGSVKGEIHQEAEKLGLAANFIGGHPMTGSEKTGYAHSSDHLLENAYYMITPASEVALDKISDYTEFVTSLGSLPMILTWEEHDYITAAISHLPHVIAASLVNVVEKLDSPEEHMKIIAAGGFKDITRIASSSPHMWQQICLENGENISKVLDEYIRMIVQAKYLIDHQDGDGLYQMFSDSREYRDSFSSASPGPIKRAYVVYCDIVDEAGAIATIATTLAMSQISIKNIGIIHNREFEEGVLKIEFYDENAMHMAVDLLRKRNYIIYER